MIPIYKPYMPENIMSGMNEILYSGQLSFGKYGKIFESQLKEYIGCENLLIINSYNTAMQVVLSTLGLQFGDEVIASPVSCLASNQPFATKGINVIWADINPQLGTLCPIDVESKITKNTKAIFHNHFCGYIGEIEAINAIGKKYNIPIIDDAIEAFGSEFKGKRMGNLGTDITIFSFQTVRLPNTIEGGAIVFENKKMCDKAILIRDYGIDRSKFRNVNGEIDPDCDIILEGYGGLMSEVNSYIGVNQMSEIAKLIERQRKNAKVWDKKFSNHFEISSLKISEGSLPNYWVYGLLTDKKSEIIDKFKKEGFYSTGVHLNNNLYSVFKNKENLTGVNDFMKKFVAIPSGWWI